MVVAGLLLLPARRPTQIPAIPGGKLHPVHHLADRLHQHAGGAAVFGVGKDGDVEDPILALEIAGAVAQLKVGQRRELDRATVAGLVTAVFELFEGGAVALVELHDDVDLAVVAFEATGAARAQGRGDSLGHLSRRQPITECLSAVDLNADFLLAIFEAAIDVLDPGELFETGFDVLHQHG